MLTIEGLRKAYGLRPVLTGVDLDVGEGEICGLLGPNGAGKTTLVSIIAGLRSADAGSVRVDGVDALRERRRVRARMGIAPQGLGVYPTLTARANLAFFGGLNGVHGRRLRGRVAEVAEAMSLTHLLDRRVAELSGGEQRRLHTAAAMLHRPRLLFLDEPTVGADVVTRARLLAEVARLAADGCTVVYATHYLAEVEEMGATVAILNDGRIVERGAFDDVVARHGVASAELEFVGDAPLLPGWTRDGSRLRRWADDPAVAVGSAIASLAANATALRTVRIVPASLEAAYLAVTGHAPEATGTPEGGGDRVEA